LEEVLDADLIVHVRDISHAQTEEQARDVTTILQSLGVAEEAPVIEVWNKIDQLDAAEAEAHLVQASRRDDLFAISALTGDGVAPLLDAIAETVKDPRSLEVLTLGFAQGRARAWLFEQGVVTEDKQTEEGYEMTVHWTQIQQDRFAKL